MVIVSCSVPSSSVGLQSSVSPFCTACRRVAVSKPGSDAVIVTARAEFLDDVLGVAEADRAPVLGDGDVEVEEVVGVEYHVLPVDFRPAHPQAVDEGEILAVHSRPGPLVD